MVSNEMESNQVARLHPTHISLSWITDQMSPLTWRLKWVQYYQIQWAMDTSTGFQAPLQSSIILKAVPDQRLVRCRPERFQVHQHGSAKIKDEPNPLGSAWQSDEGEGLGRARTYLIWGLPSSGFSTPRRL